MIPPALRNTLVSTGAALALVAGIGGYVAIDGQRVPPEVIAAMQIGSYYESSGRHIGTPYRDVIGKGQPWTVCAGITGPDVVPGRTYSPTDCKRLETKAYMSAWRETRPLFSRWDEYGLWQRASFVDMVFNLGAPAVATSTMRRLANAGDLSGACEQQPRWIYGTVSGKKQALRGLIDRRGTTRELCAEWADNDGVLGDG